MKLIIDRAKWLRGGKGPSMLLRPQDGAMCCLGFFGRACGIAKKTLRAKPCPSDVGVKNRGQWPEWLLEADRSDSREGQLLMSDNDAMALTARERERRIAKRFAEHGIAVRFVGRTEKSP